jgi:hypothetical protein
LKTKSKPKAKKIAKGKAPGARSARVYRVVEKLAGKAAEITAPQAKAVYQVLSHSKNGLTAPQILEKLKETFPSKQPAGVVAATLYDLRRGSGVCSKVGPGLVEIAEAAPAAKKSTKPKAAQPAPAQ